MSIQFNKDLLPMKAHFFLFNAGTAPVIPFIPTLAYQLGFSTFVVGTIYTVLPIIGMLAKPLFGFIADRYHRHRFLFLSSEILTAIALFLIMFVPPISTPKTTVQFHCHAGESDLRICSGSTFDTCTTSNLQSHIQNDLFCKLSCQQAQPFVWDIICNDWLKQNEKIEACNNTFAENFEINTYINMAHIIKDEQCLYFLIPHIQGEIQGHNVTMYCTKDKPYFNATCEIECHNEYFAAQLSSQSVITNNDAFKLYQFWLFFGLLILSWIGMAVTVSIGDAVCFAILGEHHYLYGKQRLYGSIGWGIFAVIAGLLVDKLSGDNINKNYTIVFWMSAIIIAFDVFATTKLKHTKTHPSPNILKDMGKMFSSFRCIIFFLWCIVIGFCTALVWNFLFIYLEELGSKISGCNYSMKTLEGLVMAIQCFGGELPLFFLSGWILKKIGHINAMSIVLFGFGIRFILYSMLEDPWYVLPIELLNGITFGLFYATMASYASIVAPPGTDATMQGFVGAIFEGIGVSMGSLIGGILFSTVGGSHTFEIYGTIAFVMFVVHVFLHKCIVSKSVENSRTEQSGIIRYLRPPVSDAQHMLDDQEYNIVT